MASSEHCSDCCDIREVLSTSVQSFSSRASSTLSSSFVVETADIDDQQRQAAAQHMKISLPSKFHALVTMHLSFLLDLSGTGLSELIDHNCHTSSLSSSSSSSCSSMPTTSSSWVTSDSSTADSSNRAGAVSSLASFFSRRKPSKDHQKSSVCFGQSLTQHSISRIYPVIEFLSRPENLRQEGLFRKAGQVDRQKALCDRLALADTTDVFSDLSEFSVHDCASVLKSFLGDLPEPLLTEQYLTAYRQITDMQSDAKRLQALQLLIHLLPNEHSTLLHQVLNLLHRVTAEPGNRMTSENLAILFVPHIVVPRKTPMQELQQTSAAFTGLVSFMIEHVDEMYQFPDALIRDVAFYYRHLSECAVTTPGSDEDENIPSSCANSAVKKKADDSDDDVLVTVVGFADRQASQQAAAELDTAKAIADLYDHVSNLPDSAYKRRFLKQFNKSLGTPGSATPTKRKFPLSFTQSFKKILKRRHKVGVEPDDNTLAGDTTLPVKKLDTPNRPVGDNICDTTGISLDTPVKNLFGNPVATNGHCRDAMIKSVENVTDSRPRPECHPQMDSIDNPVTPNCGLLSKDKTAQLSKSDVCLSKPRRSSSGVVRRPEVVSFAADMCCENDDDDDINSCSDKENVAASDSCANRVFLFHHTQSVVAMERIFAEQRLPNYVKPKGYISPLSYKRFVTTPSHAPTVTVIAKP